MSYVKTDSGLIVPVAEFAEIPKTEQPDFREVATTLDGRDITRGYVDAIPILEPEDTVLTRRGGGELEIYDEVLRDDQVIAVLEQRFDAVIGTELEVIPASDSPKDQAAAASIRENMEAIGFDNVTKKMLYGVFYGFAVGEAIWARDGRRVFADSIKVRNRARFGFRPAGDLVMRTTARPDGEELPGRKFWTFSTGATHDDEPYGIGLAHWLYWPVFFKRNGIKFWLRFLDKFALPTTVGKYPTNSSKAEQATLLAATRALQNDTGIIIPDGMMIELLEASRSGVADNSGLYDRMNEAISKVVVGQTMTADSGSSLSQSETHASVLSRKVCADADLICDSFNRTIVTWLTEWNYPGAGIPRVWRRMDDGEDLDARASRDGKIYLMGYRPTQKYVDDVYGAGFEPRPMGPEGGGGPAFAAPTDPPENPAPEIADQLQAEAADPLRVWLDVIQQKAATADSLEDLRDNLLNSYGDLPSQQLGDVMALAFAAADARGREAVIKEADA